MKGLVISAPASGSGKTTVTLGLIAALRARGLAVQPYKSGPDYIDPAFHRAAAGRESFNLDSWAMTGAQIAHLLAAGRDADIALAEGSMGLFDGVAHQGGCGNGASADIAALTGWPVLLVMDCKGQAQSAAAVALGFRQMRADVHLAGVVLNRVASARHEALMRHALDPLGIRVLGVLPREAAIELPERHLGLVQAREHATLAALLAQAGQAATRYLDLDAIVAAAAGQGVEAGPFRPLPPPAERIALAQDDAFSFIYPHLIAGWRAAGATIVPFSPLADQAPDDSAGACWLPGGYPELHAGRLAAATHFRDGLSRFAETRPVHGECGGYMALGAGLVDADGTRHRMAGLLGLETSYAKRRMHLGYRLAAPLAPIAGAYGQPLTGHEFHYATILSQPDAPLARVTDANGAEVAETGSHRAMPGGGHVSGSFFHMIAESPMSGLTRAP
ncbi:hydrogenobyrinic acid a,c-diamide synthase (glutamine-hydrolysing) /cobyrinate a,c-diamide synthase [Paracoccus halophilus]|uniref:Hydrogenobyrinate a,c-diamide synthase n=1 Tax=Paracoccus halophilus TaxID=376733 RepID=A0A099F3V3_9RHOB|nr:cobyrinate a,c-diamide synthase [Paracoccus halophilus]KGJ05395.1 cobyrinic acid a,c-diamide synthase [Paracoccus halophilus]SFA49041.1 hydrogenobyrinic acid a,c-diamide synthase (glutamine-hydrolysing) /cobyrinate a,c-diamide synthase [Paracoccus halophilus]